MGWIRTDYGNGWTPPPIQQIYTKSVATTSFNGKTLTVLFNGQRFKSIYLKDPDLGWSASIISLKATVVDPNGVEKIYQYSVGNDSFDIELSCAGEYKITFTLICLLLFFCYVIIMKTYGILSIKNIFVYKLDLGLCK